MELERLLVEMSRYGKVHLGQLGREGGWDCKIEVFIAGEGVTMEVKSDYKLNRLSPMEAAMQCSERLVALMNEMSAKSKTVALPSLSGGGV